MNKREETYHMTEKEMARLKVAERLLEGNIKVKDAAEILGLSTRQIIRIKKGVRQNGPKAVIHNNRLRKPKNTTDDKIKNMVIGLKKEKYPNTNFAHFTELLSEQEGITLSQPTVHRMLRDAGIVSPKKKKKKRTHYYRKRKECPGMMAQLDSSPYVWFGDEALALHGAIDDSSGDILGLCLCRQECLEGYFEIIRQMIKGYGIPISTYSDRHSIFFSPKGRLTIEDQLEGRLEPYTQFSRAMAELGINMIAAGSPQAKGRIERLWGTLQDRLVQEFAIHKICSIESANVFLKKYIAKFNRRFSVIPKGKPVFRKLAAGTDLDCILCRKEARKLDAGSAFSYGGKYFQLVSGGRPAAAIAGSSLDVLTSDKIGIKARYSGKVYCLARLDMPQKISKQKSIKKRIYKGNKSKTHPWRIGKLASEIAYDKTSQEIACALFDSTIAWNPGRY